jgi:hypothetical protein
VTSLPFVFTHTYCKCTYIFIYTTISIDILLFRLACPPTPLLVVFPFLLVSQTIPPDHTIHTLVVPGSQIYLLHQTPFWFFLYALLVLLVSVLVCGFLLVSLNCFFSVFLRMSPDGAFYNLMLSKSLLTLSFSISFSSSTTLFVSLSILFPSSIMISTSYSVANCLNISVSSFCGRFFSITACYILPDLSHLLIPHHLSPYVN